MMRFAVVAAALACGLAKAYDSTKTETKYEIQCLSDGGTINEDGDCVPAAGKTAVPNQEMKDYFFEAYDNQHNCVVSLKHPDKPRSLSFCHKFNDKACCPPVMDDENAEIFDQLTSLGLSCRLRGDIRDDPIAKWYCMNCDPEQPQYIRNAAYTHDKEQVMLVEARWAREEFGSDPILAGPQGRFKDCGLLKSSPCLDHSGNAIDDRDRYTCGDDPYYPASVKVENADGTVDVDKSIEAFMMDVDMGPPALDDYGYKLIEDCVNFCDEATIEKHYTDSTTLEELMMPPCKRSQDQLQKNTYAFNFAISGTNNPPVEKNSAADPPVEEVAQVFNVSDISASGKMTFRQFFCQTKGGATCFDKEKAPLKCDDASIRLANPCCCATWTAEKCFSAASGLFSTASAAALAAVSAALHLLLA